jgi:2-polyprenyl-3-methyl-5-hydroxy-6-metoxy-1,4-benzoquinol methylase
MVAANKYQCWADASPFNAHRHMLDMVGANRRVLDIGCASGYLAERMKARGCIVTGIEPDAEAAEMARPHCERVIAGRADDLTTLASVGARFDVILCGDVLEHMADPAPVLTFLPSMLAPEGSLVVSIPNIAYLRTRLDLLRGRFEYTDDGILDRTHLRFFTLASARRFFNECGWQEVEFRPTESGRAPYAAVRRWPSLLAPQFVFRLVPQISSSNRG